MEKRIEVYMIHRRDAFEVEVLFKGKVGTANPVLLELMRFTCTSVSVGKLGGVHAPLHELGQNIRLKQKSHFSRKFVRMSVIDRERKSDQLFTFGSISGQKGPYEVRFLHNDLTGLV